MGSPFAKFGNPFMTFSVFLFQKQFSKNFIDTIRLRVKGGNGGMGLPKYGGVGGKGGDVYVEARKKTILNHTWKKYSKLLVTAESGENSKTMKVFGKPGNDVIIPVPPGVVVYDEFMRKMGELNAVGDKIMVAEGGPGGGPNSVPAYSGSKGHSQLITIDLKLIADIGLVGFPNAGKSTLLNSLSRAKPKIADYAFTTLRPHLGILEYSDLRKISMADLPGLVEGASDDVGMGHEFLKHVERSSLLLLVVDIFGFQLTPQCSHRNCIESVILLNKELELYKSELLDKPAVLAINKMDLPGALTAFKEILPTFKDLPSYAASRLPEKLRPEKYLKFFDILPISAKSDKDSTEKLKQVLRECLDENFESSIMEMMTKNEMNLLKKVRQYQQLTHTAM
ncbi:conserved hypothetical protein [Pediculus humanus corporis]|uniref:GTP-binding protein 10 n=1 Tax=Pediculus humanus subsp. corporis TaxID=121224 RepID=E0VBS4_PEDHC|nr:uncharacterized protein Phum_PHUM067630 [Pediculus humanus corporis]EEB10830.1 conserved hypothetical protein [Pediculus humanus corporis]